MKQAVDNQGVESLTNCVVELFKLDRGSVFLDSVDVSPILKVIHDLLPSAKLC
jgi:hypothetical protein